MSCCFNKHIFLFLFLSLILLSHSAKAFDDHDDFQPLRLQGGGVRGIVDPSMIDDLGRQAGVVSHERGHASTDNQRSLLAQGIGYAEVLRQLHRMRGASPLNPTDASSQREFVERMEGVHAHQTHVYTVGFIRMSDFQRERGSGLGIHEMRVRGDASRQNENRFAAQPRVARSRCSFDLTRPGTITMKAFNKVSRGELKTYEVNCHGKDGCHICFEPIGSTCMYSRVKENEASLLLNDTVAHVFHSGCLRKSRERNNKNPLNRNPITDDNLVILKGADLQVALNYEERFGALRQSVRNLDSDMQLARWNAVRHEMSLSQYIRQHPETLFGMFEILGHQARALHKGLAGPVMFKLQGDAKFDVTTQRGLIGFAEQIVMGLSPANGPFTEIVRAQLGILNPYSVFVRNVVLFHSNPSAFFRMVREPRQRNKLSVSSGPVSLGYDPGASGGMDKITDALVRMKALVAQVLKDALDTHAGAYADHGVVGIDGGLSI